MLPDNSFPGMKTVKLKETVAMTCWYLWWTRHQRTHNESVSPIHKCKLSILAITANAGKVNKARMMGVKWTRPEARVLKLNVDASFYADSCAGSVGAVIRDYEGNFVAAKSVLLPHVHSAALSEARAMRVGMSLASSLGCNRIITESDSIETIEAYSANRDAGLRARQFSQIVWT
uniref:Uncharacterized protein n=1 Tax=Avena sativa TaxID=4498 RepID=A0ACD5ZW00_AVESA